MATPEENGGAEPSAGISTRGPELFVALLLVILALMVVSDSLRVGIGWADDGPRSGYFPFYVGLILLACALWIGFSALRTGPKAQPKEVFAEISQLRSVWAILWPMSIFVVAVTQLGIYLPSALLIAYFMRRHGQHRVWLTALIAVGVPLFFFLVFERWFLVPLPKGPIETWLGL